MIQKPTIVVVGAGAVGQVVGHFLQRSGASVVFLVRAKYKDSATNFTLHALPCRGDAPLGAANFGAIASIRELAELNVTELHLTIPSSLEAGPWLRELLAAVPNATIVAYPPAPQDRATLLGSGADVARLVTVFVGFIAFAAPLGAEPWPQAGTAYWFPPLSPTLFSGPPELVSRITNTLRSAGMPSRVHPNVTAYGAQPAAMLAAYMAALECAEWSLRAFVRTPNLARATAAAHEAGRIASGKPAALTLRLLLTPIVLRIVVGIAKRVVPFSLEQYLHKHFAKVRAQTQAMVAELVTSGRQQGLPTAALSTLAVDAWGHTPTLDSATVNRKRATE
jgi:ketopantoate reductase